MKGEEYTSDWGAESIQKSLIQQIEDSEEAALGVVNKLIDITEPVMEQRLRVWERYQRKYRRGLTYLMGVTNEVPLYFTNYVYAIVEVAKANMTRNLPELSAKPRGLKDDLAAEVLTRVLRDELARSGLKAKTREVLHYGLTNTLGWFKIGYDEDEDGLSLMGCHPSTVLIDPTCTDYKDPRWIIQKFSNVDNSKIYDMYGKYPKKNDEIHGGSVSQSDNPLYTLGNNMREISDVAPVSDLYECWIRSYEPKRPNNWYVVTIANDTVLEQNYSDYEHNRHPFVPWIAGEDFNSDNFYARGAGYIEEMEPLQDRADALDMRIYKNISMLSNRQKIVSAQSGINPAIADNTTGRVLVANGDPSKSIYYDTPPQFGRDVYEYRSATEMLIQTVTGIMDVTAGRRPTGVIAGKAITALKDSAELRLTDGGDTFALVISDLGDLGLQIILQYVSSEKIVRATDVGKEDRRVIARYPQSLAKKTELADMVVAAEERQVQGTMAGFGQMGLMGGGMSGGDPGQGLGMGLQGTLGGGMGGDLGMMGGMGAEPQAQDPIQMYTPEDAPPEDLETIDGITPELRRLREEWKKRNNISLVLEDVKYKWDVFANTDSALPNTAQERGQTASELFRLGAIDRQALLTALNYPDAEGILQRLASTTTGKNAGTPLAESGADPLAQMMMEMTQQGGGMPGQGVPGQSQPVPGGAGPQGNFQTQIRK